MDNNKLRKQTRFAAIACVVYLLLTIFYHHIDKYSPDALRIVLTLLIPVAFIAIIVYFIKGLMTILRHRKQLTFAIFLPTLICLFTLTYTLFSPWRLDSDKLESPVMIRACYEGTQNQAYIKLRKDKSFEINWTGVFFYDEWFLGTYSQKGDTIFLKYKTDQPYAFGDTILNNGRSLITVNKFKKDSAQHFAPFYLGYCKGLN
jgi:hypothetical protein